jgi:hypothetical protein
MSFSYFTIDHTYLIVPLGVYLATFFWLNMTWFFVYFFYVGWFACFIHMIVVCADCWVFHRVWTGDPGYVSATYKVRVCLFVSITFNLHRSNAQQ